jgi:hypothetical protein
MSYGAYMYFQIASMGTRYEHASMLGANKQANF